MTRLVHDMDCTKLVRIPEVSSIVSTQLLGVGMDIRRRAVEALDFRRRRHEASSFCLESLTSIGARPEQRKCSARQSGYFVPAWGRGS